jgi:type IV pilus assembly protein PilQ
MESEGSEGDAVSTPRIPVISSARPEVTMVPCTARSLIRLVTLVSVALWSIAAPAAAQTVDIKKTHAEFSMEFRDAEIKDVLRAVGQAANLNMIVSDAVSGKVSLSIKDVDIWAALESILKTKGLTYVRDGNMVRVLSVAEARDHDMETRVFPLQHAKSKDILPILKGDNPSAKISEDSRMNAIVVRDLSLNLDRMARLLKELDVKMPQVLIEAKIVEVSSNYARELGVQWGGQFSSTSSKGTTVMSGGTTGGQAAVVGSTVHYPQTGDIGASGNAFVVNLPANVGVGSGGALGISFGKLGGKLTLDLQLSAMQSTGNGKILSSPKVMTMNNKEAKISSGTDIPIRTVSSTAQTTGGSINTASVQMISASLGLSAIPTITNDNKIAMTINVEKSEPDFSHQVDGIPTITKRNATSEVVMNNGETIVLGGILTKNESETESGVPLLSQIPVLGWLFKKKSTIENQTELMIFITPTIVSD